MPPVSKRHKHTDASSENGEHVFVKKHIESEEKISTVKKSHKKQHSFRKHFGHKNDEALSRDQISDNLTAIYQNQDGSLPDMKNFQKSRRVKVVQAFFRLLVMGLLAVVLASGFIYFSNKNETQGSDVVFAVTGSENVKIGDSVTFILRYKNPQSVPLSQAVLTVRYPQGFVFEKSSRAPTNDSNDEWKLGALRGNEEGTLEITGRVFGSFGEKQSLRAFFNYLPANFSSEFQKVSTFSFTLARSPVTLALKAPANTTYGASIPLEISVSREAGFSINSLSVVIDPQNVFVKKSSEPQSDQVSDLVWSLNAASVTSTIKVQGAFLSTDTATSSTNPIVIKVVGYTTPQKTGNPVVLAEVTYLPTLVHTAVEAKVVVNGALSDGTVLPGENLNASVVLRNTGQSAVKNIELIFTVEAPAIGRQSILDWSRIQDPKDGVIAGKSLNDTRRQGVITWSSKQISDLANLAPGKEVRIDVVIPVKKDQGDAEDYASWNIVSGSEAKYELEGQKTTINSNSVNIIINSDMALEVRDEVRGELSNTHTVTWLLSNTYHPLKDIELSTDVYGDITFDESQLTVPAGTATYDKTKKSLKWIIPQMPLGIDVYALQFTLINNKPNPTQKQLTSKVKVKALDTVTGKEMIIAGDEVLANAPVTP